jgi:hypothetical protein
VKKRWRRLARKGCGFDYGPLPQGAGIRFGYAAPDSYGRAGLGGYLLGNSQLHCVQELQQLQELLQAGWELWCVRAREVGASTKRHHPASWHIPQGSAQAGRTSSKWTLQGHHEKGHPVLTKRGVGEQLLLAAPVRVESLRPAEDKADKGTNEIPGARMVIPRFSRWAPTFRRVLRWQARTFQAPAGVGWRQTAQTRRSPSKRGETLRKRRALLKAVPMDKLRRGQEQSRYLGGRELSHRDIRKPRAAYGGAGSVESGPVRLRSRAKILG